MMIMQTMELGDHYLSGYSHLIHSYPKDEFSLNAISKPRVLKGSQSLQRYTLV
jgi:hypothetical protein